jgi:tRNA(Ile)-lysidine synthase
MAAALPLDMDALPRGARLVVAVSGGADSVALLHALWRRRRARRWTLAVAHLDHGIRGREAAADAAFVAALARRLRIPCHLGRARVPALARRRGVSLEMAAREARYRFLGQVARETGAAGVVTAHTADDQAETVLLKLLRGSARGGLSGMDAVSVREGIRLVRPLLAVRRGAIEDYLRRHRLEWREDASNADPAFLRNRVRHGLLPLLERDYNPRVREALVRTATVLADEDRWMDDLARVALREGLCTDGRLDLTPLARQPLAARRRILRLWLAGRGVPADGVDFDRIVALEGLCRCGEGSARMSLGSGWEAVRHYRHVAVVGEGAEGRGKVPVRRRVKAPGVTRIPELGVRLVLTLGPGVARPRGERPGAYPAVASLDAGVWAGCPLWLRAWRPGDRFRPLGMAGSRKLQDILVDLKVPRAERARVLVLECEGEIVWVPGYRVAQAWAVREPAARQLQLILHAIHPPTP